MRRVYGALLLVLVAGCAGPDPDIPETTSVKAQQEQESLQACQQAVADTLKDPGSAQFRNTTVDVTVVYDAGTGSASVTGEMNGKNGFGAYNGYKKFSCAAFGIPGNLRTESVTVEQ